ncbi:uncharacterized protein LOC121867853 [Homarus americanus]|uniref:uncharacterized protein LOC121867853 n=1 Tax=Homarus americanus TaxID=6706 RepID=UPI001C4908F0|nr:uncharacterized protein LOC121867853 [Homarus americanus]
MMLIFAVTFGSGTYTRSTQPPSGNLIGNGRCLLTKETHRFEWESSYVKKTLIRYLMSTPQAKLTPARVRKAAKKIEKRFGASSHEVNTTLTEAPTTLTEAPTTLTEAPTTLTEAPTTLTEAPTTLTEAPTTLTEAPTTLTEAPTTLTEADSQH